MSPSATSRTDSKREGGGSEGTRSGLPASRSTGVLDEYDPGVITSRVDFLTELGIPYDEFFRRLVEEHGGVLPQKEFVEYTNLSPPTISRLLIEMEDDGTIVRVRNGREKLVTLPEYATRISSFVAEHGNDTARS